MLGLEDGRVVGESLCNNNIISEITEDDAVLGKILGVEDDVVIVVTQGLMLGSEVDIVLGKPLVTGGCIYLGRGSASFQGLHQLY